MIWFLCSHCATMNRGAEFCLDLVLQRSCSTSAQDASNQYMLTVKRSMWFYFSDDRELDLRSLHDVPLVHRKESTVDLSLSSVCGSGSAENQASNLDWAFVGEMALPHVL